MSEFSFNRRCVVLYSGGLDSLLAVYIMRDMGFEVFPLFVGTPFYKKDESELKRSLSGLSLELKVVYDTEGYMEVIKSPQFGYGKGFNPCIDCKIFFYRKAREFMKEVSATFVVTGEVLGQRPFSQRSYSVLRSIEKRAFLTDLVLRPLSAQCLPETAMEKSGIVDRERLFCITGRGRKTQMELAERFGIKEYASPAGGCLLTDRIISSRVKEMLKSGYGVYDLELIDKGRHFRIGAGRFVVSRNLSESRFFIDNYMGRLPLLRCANAPGAIGLFTNTPNEEEKKIAAAILLRYSKKAESVVYVEDGRVEPVDAVELTDEELEGLRIV